ncbi:MAG: hypothetical protein ACFFD4_03440 [Candidatus Odinarchaeota archaeon]
MKNTCSRGLSPIPVHELDMPLMLRIKDKEIPVIGQFSLHSAGTRIEKVFLNISWSKRHFLNFVDVFRDFYRINLDYNWFKAINDQDKVRLVVSLRNKWLKVLNDNYRSGNLENSILTLTTLDCWKLVDIEYELIPR